MRIRFWCLKHPTVCESELSVACRMYFVSPMDPRPSRLVTRLSSAQTEDAVTVLCDAFRDYPVMRYVLGPSGDYDRRLRTLIGFFVSARVYRDEPVLGVHDRDGSLSAVAILSLPGERAAPEALATRREEVWAELGAAERERYEAYGAACAPFIVASPHYHLNMIGVRRSHAGRGLARKLLESVHRLSDADGRSSGVSLTTETEQNLPLYEYFGYRRIGHAVIGDRLETWGFFREAVRR
jgi:GNAT superfamily N-acetyltransferase